MSDNKQYTTVRQEAHETFEEKKSIFIGHAAPAETEAEALAFLSRIRAEYPDATHNVYAYQLRENGTMRYSDDREPQGTAGLPVLDVLRKAEIQDVVVVVTRYFGGTLLGTGGLVRAYTQAAKMAVEAAEIVRRAELSMMQLGCSYTDYQKILPQLQKDTVRIEDTAFTDRVSIRVAMLTENCDEFRKTITELAGARVAFTSLGTRYDFF